MFDLISDGDEPSVSLGPAAGVSSPSCPAPLGATVTAHGTRFAVYTTTARTCAVRLFDDQRRPRATHALAPSGDGRFEAEIVGVGPGDLYQFVLDGRELPDPYARFLPSGVHGPAQVVASRHRFRHAPVSRPLREHVVYELHVGTFSDPGTYAGVRARLPELRALGVTAIEVMPVAAFAGTRGWGYDGVALFAPHAAYGTPDELCALVDEAHGLGLSVFLDVVYNHFGPAGNYLAAYSPEYFTHDFRNAWGDAPNYAHPAMRRLVLDNAVMWLAEYRFDGLRLDATHAIVDPSPRHLLRELADEAASLRPRRLLIAEDERNEPALVTEMGLDAVWADDFHHQLRVTLTGEQDGYYAGYHPGVVGIRDAIRRGWLYQGQVYPPSGHRRGKPATGLPRESLVLCTQNHDQVGNRAIGDRLSDVVSVDAYCAASVLLLFLPSTPLLFMGQEWAASTPFQFFTDHEPELGRQITQGRRAEFRGFAVFTAPGAADCIPDPQAADTFLRSRLRWDERDRPPHARVLDCYRRALALRHRDPVLRAGGDAALTADADGDLLIVRRASGGAERVLLVNFGAAPLPAPADARGRPVLLTSADGRAPARAGDEVPPATALLLGDAP